LGTQRVNPHKGFPEPRAQNRPDMVEHNGHTKDHNLIENLRTLSLMSCRHFPKIEQDITEILQLKKQPQERDNVENKERTEHGDEWV
jgi:hypothetical protein